MADVLLHPDGIACCRLYCVDASGVHLQPPHYPACSLGLEEMVNQLTLVED